MVGVYTHTDSHMYACILKILTECARERKCSKLFIQKYSMWLFQIYCFSFLGKINEIRRQDAYTIRTAFGKYNIVNERTSMLIKLTCAGFFFWFLFMQGGMCMKQFLHRESSKVFTLQEV